MADMTLTDMTPFFERHERRSRRAFVTILSTNLTLAVVIFAYGALTTGSPGAVLGRQWISIVVYPLFFAGFWFAIARYQRSRPRPPDGRLPMNEDDARSVARVANAGFVFVACLGVIVIASQTGLALKQFGAMQSLNKDVGDWLGRAIVAASGLLTAYFGNAWSRMPVPRAPEQNPATQMKFKRLFAWLMVIHGLLLALAALFLPIPAMFVGIVIVSMSMVLSMAASVIMFRNLLKSPSAS